MHRSSPFHIQLREALPLALGGLLPEVEIRWEEWGDPEAPGDRTLLLMPALSAGSHACSHDDDPTPGWWEDMIGPGRALDTDRYRVLCASILGSPFGTTSPLSPDPRTGRWYGRAFPQITPADQARVHARLLDHLGLDRVHAVIGSSLGGMQALQFAALFPERCGRLVAISTTGKSSPGTVAFRRVGRLAVMTDPDYKDGEYEPGHGPHRGLMVARELGMITYRSRDEFNKRFPWDADGPLTAQGLSFEVERYLHAQGSRFVHRYDANCYLLLSRCADLMDLGAGQRNYAEGVLRIEAPSLILGVERDALIPCDEQRHLAHLLESHGREVHFEVSSSIYGHDAFLKDTEWFTPRLREFLGA